MVNKKVIGRGVAGVAGVGVDDRSVFPHPSGHCPFLPTLLTDQLFRAESCCCWLRLSNITVHSVLVTTAVGVAAVVAHNVYSQPQHFTPGHAYLIIIYCNNLSVKDSHKLLLSVD